MASAILPLPTNPNFLPLRAMFKPPGFILGRVPKVAARSLCGAFTLPLLKYIKYSHVLPPCGSKKLPA
jgi:hypothetical protein